MFVLIFLQSGILFGSKLNESHRRFRITVYVNVVISAFVQVNSHLGFHDFAAAVFYYNLFAGFPLDCVISYIFGVLNRFVFAAVPPQKRKNRRFRQFIHHIHVGKSNVERSNKRTYCRKQQ